MSAALGRIASLFLLALICMPGAVAREGLHLGMARQALRLNANPIRRVVTMLQSMQEKVTLEGKAEAELFDKFQCYCKTGTGDLKTSIATSGDKIEQLKSSIEETDAAKKALASDLDEAKTAREEATTALGSAKALRKKEFGSYTKESTELKSNIEALGKAIAALRTGMMGAFLQTSGAAVTRKLALGMDMNAAERDMLLAFLSQGQSATSGYVPQSHEIVGILEQMKETMEGDLSEVTGKETSDAESYEKLSAAKSDEVEALTKSIETKIARLGEAGVQLADMKDDLKHTTESLAKDKEFLAELTSSCGTKASEYEERKKMRAAESLAISETIKILNDDEALELFKKTLPSPSLLQLQANSRQMRDIALEKLKGRRGGRSHDYRLNLITLAIRGKSASFEKVIEMIDSMIKLLGREDADDASKKNYCESSLDKTEDELKMLHKDKLSIESAIASDEESLSKETEEIKSLTAGIEELDKQVAEVTEQRKEEHEEYVKTLADDSAAVEIIGYAKKRLNKFYSPKLVKPAFFEEEQDGDAAYGTAFVQVSASQPETWGTYQKMGEQSAGVIALMDALASDLQKEITEMQIAEKKAQSDYEELMEGSAAKRTSDAQSISAKEGLKAEIEEKMSIANTEKKAKVAEIVATAESLKELHESCDWLLENFVVRKEARAGEVESLKNAKAVLSGADYSLLQRAHVHHHHI